MCIDYYNYYYYDSSWFGFEILIFLHAHLTLLSSSNPWNWKIPTKFDSKGLKGTAADPQTNMENTSLNMCVHTHTHTHTYRHRRQHNLKLIINRIGWGPFLFIFSLSFFAIQANQSKMMAMMAIKIWTMTMHEKRKREKEKKIACQYPWAIILNAYCVCCSFVIMTTGEK